MIFYFVGACNVQPINFNPTTKLTNLKTLEIYQSYDSGGGASLITFKGDINATVLQFNPLQILSQCLMMMTDVLPRPVTKR